MKSNRETDNKVKQSDNGAQEEEVQKTPAMMGIANATSVMNA